MAKTYSFVLCVVKYSGFTQSIDIKLGRKKKKKHWDTKIYVVWPFGLRPTTMGGDEKNFFTKKIWKLQYVTNTFKNLNSKYMHMCACAYVYMFSKVD